MSKPNKDGWIRHRGGKCPVEAGALVDVRYRDGRVNIGVKAGISGESGSVEWSAENWDNNGIPCDIMAFRIHKPAEQPVIEPAVVANVQAFNERAELRYDPCADGPLQWRDRITEIDRTVEALEEERVALVQRLEGEGFRLIERINSCIADAMHAHDDMSDWRNWRDGDKVLCIKSHHKAFITEGEIYRIFGLSEVDEPESISFLDDDGDLMEYKACNFKFHSRPSK